MVSPASRRHSRPARAEGRAALMPYFTLGYPDIATSEAVVRAIAAAGADLIELGMPFSDPLADGPTIQHSTQVALEQGMTLTRGLALTSRLREAGVTQPLLLMGYVNPILAYGVSRYVADAEAAGADGFIVPDLPPEEAGELETACRAHGLALVFLLAPTSTPERIAAVVSHATGFVYLVSLAGVTGARDRLPPDLAAFVGRVRSATSLPLAVGFGIATPEHASAVGDVRRRRDRRLGAGQGGGGGRRSRCGRGSLRACVERGVAPCNEYVGTAVSHRGHRDHRGLTKNESGPPSPFISVYSVFSVAQFGAPALPTLRLTKPSGAWYHPARCGKGFNRATQSSVYRPWRVLLFLFYPPLGGRCAAPDGRSVIIT